MNARRALLALALSCCVPVEAGAKVVRVEIESREDVLGGRPFGAVGPYEKITGTVYFGFDPTDPANARIVDIEQAPRNAEGLVEARANFMVLRPKNRVPGGGVAFLEVSNRGRKAGLGYFNAGSFALDPVEADDYGDALLMRLGLTVIWVGWQHDVPRQEGLLRLQVPIAREDGEPISGLVRADWVVDRATRTLALAHRGHIAYPVAEPDDSDAVLTVREGRDAPRRVVPRESWRFAREESRRVVADRTHIYMASGFEAGRIYELVYRAEDPRLVGLGLAAIRDMMSYARYDPDSPFPVRQGIAFGVSQTGRFLRHFLYQGFNTDESDRPAFDGMVIHSAGAGRGSFNHRFAQPSRDAHRYSAFFYPTDIFPFTSRSQTDPVTGKTDGLLSQARAPLPKVFYTNTGYEYWGRAASLIHTRVDGRQDFEPLPNERIYHLASGQHFVSGFPPDPEGHLDGADAYRGNPLDFLVNLRALLVAMIEWVRDDRPPPASAYPRIDNGTLVPLDRVDFPDIPGVTFPTVAHRAYRADYGPRWEEGIVTIQPPELGPAFPARVPQVDSLGNELGGLRNVEIRVPVATYTPWHLRRGYSGGNGELTDFYGTFIPLLRTEAERQAAGDPRPSLESLYPSRADYLDRVRRAAEQLVEERVLLAEDIERVTARAERYLDWILGR